MTLREARKRRRAECPARFCNEAKSHFRSNPKGTDALGRHSALHSSLRRSVLASEFFNIVRLDWRPMSSVRIRRYGVNRP